MQIFKFLLTSIEFVYTLHVRIIFPYILVYFLCTTCKLLSFKEDDESKKIYLRRDFI